MSRLSVSQARSIQRVAPTYTADPVVVERGKMLGEVQRGRNLQAEITRAADLLTLPDTAGGVKRSGKLTDRGAYGKFRKVIKTVKSLGTRLNKKSLEEAVTEARTWVALDNTKLADAGRDKVTGAKTSGGGLDCRGGGVGPRNGRAASHAS